ncbi:MAG: TolC family protein [Arenicellales bacterium]
MNLSRRLSAWLLCAAAAGLFGSPIKVSAAVETGGILHSLTLERAIGLALTRNRSLAISALGPRSAALSVDTARSAFAISAHPEVSINTLASGRGATTLGLSASRKFRTGTELSSRVVREEFQGIDGNQERLVVEVSQPLFRFAGRLVNEEPIVQARSDLRRARRRLASQKQDLVVDVAREYENILRLQQQLEADRGSYKRSETLFKRTSAREKLGRASRIDTLRVDLQRGQAQSRLESDREQLESTKRAFAELLGFDPGTSFRLEPTVALDINVPPLEEAVRIAFDNRLDYAQALEDRVDSQRGVRIARKGLWPDVRVVARYEHTYDAALGGLIDDNRWFLGLSADTDFNHTRERNALKQAGIDAESARQFVEMVQLSIARELQQRMLAYHRAAADLKIRERNLRYAKARLDLARRLFDIGRGDNFTVTDAEQAFVQAQSDHLAGKSDASITAYELLRTMGTLTEVPDTLKPRRL